MSYIKDKIFINIQQQNSISSKLIEIKREKNLRFLKNWACFKESLR
jgi:hypothetical protein